MGRVQTLGSPLPRWSELSRIGTPRGAHVVAKAQHSFARENVAGDVRHVRYVVSTGGALTATPEFTSPAPAVEREVIRFTKEMFLAA
jgi:hypothetical protein